MSRLTTTTPFHTLHLSGQPIWLFDLDIDNTERAYRQTELDRAMGEFFAEKIAQANEVHFWQNFEQFIQIIHTKGQPAIAVFLAKNGNKVTFPLAISYALPYVAVALSGAIYCEKLEAHRIGLDMCDVADFAVMSSAEKQQFCHDYFANMPATEDSRVLARRWSVLEATLKHLQLPLSAVQDNRYFYDYLPPLSVFSEKVYLKKGDFWLSVVMD